MCPKRGEIASLACEDVAKLFETPGKAAEFGHAQCREGLKCLRIYENNETLLILAKKNIGNKAAKRQPVILKGNRQCASIWAFQADKEPQNEDLDDELHQ